MHKQTHTSTNLHRNSHRVGHVYSRNKQILRVWNTMSQWLSIPYQKSLTVRFWLFRIQNRFYILNSLFHHFNIQKLKMSIKRNQLNYYCIYSFVVIVYIIEYENRVMNGASIVDWQTLGSASDGLQRHDGKTHIVTHAFISKVTSFKIYVCVFIWESNHNLCSANTNWLLFQNVCPMLYLLRLC